MVIYVIENKINGKKYVGQTIHSLNRRWSLHCHYSSGCSAIHNAIEKHGKENFTIKVIDTASTRDELDEKEIYWINKLNTLKPNGYNLKSGGKHCVYSQETKDKISKAHKGRYGGENNPHYGIPHSKEAKEKISYRLKKFYETHPSEKRIKVLCVETGKVYPSATHAFLETGIDNSQIGKACKGIFKTAGKLHWEYVTQEGG